MPVAWSIMLHVFPENVWSLSITSSLNTNGLVIAKVYSELGILVYLTNRWNPRQLKVEFPVTEQHRIHTIYLYSCIQIHVYTFAHSGIQEPPLCQFVDFIIATLWRIYRLWLGAFPLYSSNTSALPLTSFCIWSWLTPNTSQTVEELGFLLYISKAVTFFLKLRFCKTYETSWNPYRRSSFLKITMFNMSGIEYQKYNVIN